MKKFLNRSLGFYFLALLHLPSVVQGADEPSPGGARQALGRAEILFKSLGSDDPSDAKNALQESAQLLPAMEAMSAVLTNAAGKIASLRSEFERKASAGTSAAAAAFYEAELKVMKAREADLNDLGKKLDKMASQLKAKIEKAKADPDVQALLKDDELLQRTKNALEKLKSLKLPSTNP
jgi:hypothetical protein